MKNIKMHYFIGKHSKTEEYPYLNLAILEKQFNLSIPLITGANIIWKTKKKEENHKIYVGKEILLQELGKEKFKLEKFQISLEELADLAVLGYKRACILNYKKYDQILVGVEDDATIVPDYFALKKILLQIKSNQE